MIATVLNVIYAFNNFPIVYTLNDRNPGGATVYQVTFWVAATLVVTMAVVQLGLAAVRRDGKSLATLLLGVGQFAIVWAGWIIYGVAVVAACGGLTRALMEQLLSVSTWSAWQPWAPIQMGDVVDATVATVLGLMGLLLWLAAIGHLLVMLTRAGALLVLVVTTPISAAGLVSEVGRSWFWKSLRWFHAAAFTPVLMVLVLGLGVQLSTGVANGLADSAQSAIGTALPGVVLVLIGVVSPLALFKLLAFVDPGTHSGAALRSGLSAQGGVQQLLGGRAGTGGGSTSSAASATDGHGRPQAETAGQASTSARFGQAGSFSATSGSCTPTTSHNLLRNGSGGCSWSGRRSAVRRSPPTSTPQRRTVRTLHVSYTPTAPAQQRGAAAAAHPPATPKGFA